MIVINKPMMLIQKPMMFMQTHMSFMQQHMRFMQQPMKFMQQPMTFVKTTMIFMRQSELNFRTMCCDSQNNEHLNKQGLQQGPTKVSTKLWTKRSPVQKDAFNNNTGVDQSTTTAEPSFYTSNLFIPKSRPRSDQVLNQGVNQCVNQGFGGRGWFWRRSYNITGEKSSRSP